ncbi:hypothetical protein [Bryobacter aggregatus]|uniref:hypothetical protein n=1 Tax=Bryobacter aggregatus TaxID=360054 RepID=UPI0004E0E42A|nr:hypothetical protein [Bryobacter aggregatus]
MQIAADILYRVSKLLAHSALLEEALQQAAALVGEGAQLDQVRISIADPQRGTISTGLYQSPTPEARQGVVLNRELRVGHQRFGNLELASSKPALRAVELFELTSTLEGILLNYAVLLSRAAQHRRLRASLRMMEDDIRARKLETRAQSLLANRLGYTQAQAAAWLEEESRKQRVPAYVAAERLIARTHRAA